MIEEVIGFKIGGKIFDTKNAAEIYKYEQLDEIELGDVVYRKDIYGQLSSDLGIVCCIEDGKYYFTLGGIPPKEYLGHIKDGFQNVEIDNKLYNFTIGCYSRKYLVRKYNFYK